jgi:hypothetical protein
MVLLILTIVFGLVLAIKDRRSLAGIIEDIIRRK